MNIQGAVTLRTEFKDRDREVNRSSTSPLLSGGNERFNVVEFDKVIGEMVDEARGAIVAEFGEPRDYQNPRFSEASRKEVLDRVAEYKRMVASLEDQLGEQLEEVARLKKELDARSPDLVAGGGSANAWYQGISGALGVGAGGFNLKLEECKTAIELLKERSGVLREIEEIHKRQAPWARSIIIDGKPI